MQSSHIWRKLAWTRNVFLLFYSSIFFFPNKLEPRKSVVLTIKMIVECLVAKSHNCENCFSALAHIRFQLKLNHCTSTFTFWNNSFLDIPKQGDKVCQAESVRTKESSVLSNLWQTFSSHLILSSSQEEETLLSEQFLDRKFIG